MTSQSLTFDAVAKALPGPMVCPLASLLVCPRDVVPRSGGGSGPTLGTVRGGTRRAHARFAPVHRQLTRFAGEGDGVVRFLSSWSPPP